MKYSLTSVFALAMAALASPTPGGDSGILSGYGGGMDVGYPGQGLKLQHVYVTGEPQVILVGIKITPVLQTRILEVNQGVNLLSGPGLSLRQDADQFLKINERAHGVYGCSQACESRINEQHCVRFDSQLY
ncbi:hypothetical protein VFPPC_15054 [Pochonia chlamydosporia 170]|uniref:Uncharacterized protein n=1 Tax=Pochonia chlamydosporia 170 TaxID=1380566 RepID=A0A179G3J4_METCM|nr:hypothetical protein VFPPC_15054 [Pochonia chlamydosporia 170]OAQ72030.1 hypothetical protein VFPPC_15054 [Pochonia chlamydosporia 170]